MGLFGSLYTSASGMMAASRATQNTSQNVANMTTIGYKKTDTSFQDIVSNSLFSSVTSNTGGVATTDLLRATQQGQIQQTSSSLDAAINGKGFFAVQKTLDGSGQYYYTRNGQFSEYAVRTTPDSNPFVTENGGEQVFLRNSAGFYLYGWATDTDGTVLGGGTSPSSLVPIEINQFQTQGSPTTRIDLGMNLDAMQTDYNPYRLSPAQTLPVSGATQANFTRSVNVYDAVGGTHPVTFEFRKITGPMAQFTSNLGQQLTYSDALVNPAGKTPGINAGDTMTIANGAESITVTFVNGAADTSLNEASTMQDLRTIINGFTGADGNRQFELRIDDNGQLLVQSALPTESLDISTSSATVLGTAGFNIVAEPVSGGYSYDPLYDITGAGAPPYADQDFFPGLGNTTNPNTQGWWEVTAVIRDPAGGTGTIPLRTGLINFDGNGQMNAVAGAAGGIALDLGTVDFDASGTGDELTLSVNMAQFSQFSNAYNVILAEQNGAPLGERTQVSIKDGYVFAHYSNGMQIPIYQIPLATFANPDGLRAESGTVFSESPDSGAPSMFAAGQGGTGTINGSAVENSNVDISQEFGHLIVHQRMFGLNSKVINAVDEMTQNLVRLKQ